MYFRIQFSDDICLKKVEIYLPAKFRWDISIHGWDKTTSGFKKRTATILKLYFRFWFWRIYSYRHVILHTKFRSNRTIGGEIMTSYRFFKMAVTEWEMYFQVQAQIHKHCLTIYPKICPKIILRQKLWCHKIILWHVLSQFTKFVSADLGNLSLRFLEVDSNHSNCDIKVRSKCKVSKFISTRDKHTCLGPTSEIHGN